MPSLADTEFLKRIKAHIEKNTPRILDDQVIFSVLEENIRPHVVNKLKKEIISERALRISCERIPPINIFKLVNKRLSKIYSDAPIRKTEKKSDQEMIRLYESKAHFNSRMAASNSMTNAQKRSALEPYLDKGKVKIRVIPANQFLVYSEDKINELNLQVFIKFVGSIKKTENIDRGKTIETTVGLFHLYTDTEFLIMDGSGTPRFDLMKNKQGKSLKLKNGVGINPFGRIPFTYVNTSEYKLLPVANIDDVELSLLILVLLTDLNYATKYQAHSMIYMINVDTRKIDMNPDAILDLKSDGLDGEKSEVGTVNPEIDIKGTLELLASTLKLYLESKGLQVDVNSSIKSNKATSGVHEVIKNAMLVEERKDQIELFKEVEEDLWEIIALRHNALRNNGKLKGDFKEGSFSKDFEMSIHFAEQKPVVSRRDKGLMLQTEVDAGLTSLESAIRELHPEKDDDEIKREIELIKKEKKEQQTLETQIKFNDNNKKLQEDKRNKVGSNANSTSQNENPNRR